MSLGTIASLIGQQGALHEHFTHSREVSMVTLQAGTTPAGNCHLALSQ